MFKSVFSFGLVCVLIGWQAKPTLATFPAVLLLLRLAFPDERPRRRAFIETLPWFALTATRRW